MEGTTVSSKPSGGGQLKKLWYNKRVSDSGTGYAWRLSPIKVTLWFIGIIIALTLLYSFFVTDQMAYLRGFIFYAIVIMIIMLVVWVVATFILKSRKVFTHFLLGWILILGLYMGLGFICDLIGLMTFHYGVTTWLVISVLAAGAKNIDQNLDRHDFFYACLVLIIIFIANAPIFESGGFLAQVDWFINLITDRLSFIDLSNLYAE